MLGAAIKEGAISDPGVKVGALRKEAPGMGLFIPVPIDGVTETPLTGPRVIDWAAAVKVRFPGPATSTAADTTEARDFLNIRVFLREWLRGLFYRERAKTA